MKHILHTLFLKDAIDRIATKYKKNMEFSFDKYFIYANIFQMPLYYKLFSLKKDADYGLYSKIENQKHFEVIEFLIKRVCEEKYQPNQLLLLYSYICDIILNKYVDEYVMDNTKFKRFSTKKMKMNKYSKTVKYIEAQYYKERFYKPIKKHNINPKEIIIDEECFDIIEKLSAEVYYFSYGIDIFKIGYKNFIKYQTKNYKGFRLLHKFFARILDNLTRSKKYSAASIYNVSTPMKKDYLNKENKLWINTKKDCYKSFFEVYEDALEMATKLITFVSEEIFYKIKKTNEINHILSIIKNKE